MPLAFAWFSAAAFAASLTFFLYSYLVPFGAAASGTPFGRGTAVPTAVNVALFSVFALHHSVFARTSIKRRVRAIVPPSLERAFYTLIASVLFVIVCGSWQPVPGVLYELRGPWAFVGYAVVAAGVLMTALGARALDVLDLAGVRQVLDAANPPGTTGHIPLKTDGIYGFVRHPVYFGWLLIVFGIPGMTMTRLIFAVVSTLYLALAVPFEERSLVETFGPEYASYRQKVRWRMVPGLY